MVLSIIIMGLLGLGLLGVYVWLLKQSLSSISARAHLPKQLLIITVGLSPVWIGFLGILWGIYYMDEAMLLTRTIVLSIIIGIGFFALNTVLFSGGSASPDGSAEFAMSGFVLIFTSLMLLLSLCVC
jgi:hypothetical protein